MATYIEQHIEDILKILGTEYKPVQVFDLEDANEKLDDVSEYGGNDVDKVAFYTAFSTSNVNGEVINKNYTSYAVSLWFCILTETENEQEQIEARNTNRSSINEFIQRFQALDAYKRYIENQRLTVNIQEGYDRFDSLLVYANVTFNATIDIFEDTCAAFKGGSVSQFLINQEDFEAININADSSSFRGVPTGSQQGLHSWTFSLSSGVNVNIQGIAGESFTSDDLLQLQSVGIESVTGTYNNFTFSKDLTFDLNKLGVISVSHTYDGRNNGLVSSATNGAINSVAFVSLWDTRNTSTGSSSSSTITLPLSVNGVYDFLINWGDGSPIEAITTNTATHTYSSEGIYEIITVGTLKGFSFNGSGDRNKLLSISNWGQIRVAYLTVLQFQSCENLTEITAPDYPIFDHGESIEFMFRFCSNLVNITSFNSWDFSKITSLTGFLQGTSINQDVSAWDLSNNERLISTLRSTNFDQDLSAWNIEKLTQAQAFLSGAELSTDNYDKLLISWAAQNIQSNVQISFGSSKYTAGTQAEISRDILINTYGWTITDGGAA